MITLKRAEIRSRILVREARPSDRNAVFRFSRKTFVWGDYIPEVWDEWLRQKNGKVFVATIEGKPVGISHIEIDSPQEAWLSGGRPHPEYRKIGVATAVTERCLLYARKKGVKIVRLATQSNNLAAQAALNKMGFKLISEFVQMTSSNPIKEESLNSRLARRGETQAIWKYLETSKAFRRSAGLYTLVFHYFSLTESIIRSFIKNNAALVHEKDCLIDGLILIDHTVGQIWDEPSVQTCYVDGKRTAVIDMIAFLKGISFSEGTKKIYAFTCNEKPIADALQKSGFESPPSTDLLYAKNLLRRFHLKLIFGCYCRKLR